MKKVRATVFDSEALCRVTARSNSWCVLRQVLRWRHEWKEPRRAFLLLWTLCNITWKHKPKDILVLPTYLTVYCIVYIKRITVYTHAPWVNKNYCSKCTHHSYRKIYRYELNHPTNFPRELRHIHPQILQKTCIKHKFHHLTHFSTYVKLDGFVSSICKENTASISLQWKWNDSLQ